MYSSKDLESFYFQHQTEALPHGESLQSFCMQNEVPLTTFSKNDIRTVEARVDGLSTGADAAKVPLTATSDDASIRIDNPLRIGVDIRISNGLHLSQKNLSYQKKLRL